MMGNIRVIVADSARADVYELAGRRAALEKLGTISNDAGRMHERDLGTGAPGRIMSRTRGGRTSLQPRQTLKQHAAELFARQLARAIASHARSADVDGLVLVIAPRFLAQVKSHLSKSAAGRVLGEVRRDLVDVPQAQLRARVHAVLPLPRPR